MCLGFFKSSFTVNFRCLFLKVVLVISEDYFQVLFKSVKPVLLL